MVGLLWKERHHTTNLKNLGRIQQHAGRKKPGNVSMSYEVTFKKVVNNLIFSELVFSKEGYYCLDFKGLFFVNDSLVYFP